jgi:hypothetical protein
MRSCSLGPALTNKRAPSTVGAGDDAETGGSVDPVKFVGSTMWRNVVLLVARARPGRDPLGSA